MHAPRLFTLAWPLFLELLLGIGVGVVGTALAAQLSDQSGAAFALANFVAGTLFILFRVVGAGVGVVVSQALGAGRRDAADAVARAALGASTWVGGLCAALALVGAAPLMHLLNAPAEVLPLAQPLLQWLAPAMLLDAWNASMASVMRAHLRTRDTLVVMVLMHSAHIALALPLMGGVGAWPGLGLVGFAVALTLARTSALVLHLLLWRTQPGYALRTVGFSPAAAAYAGIRPRSQIVQAMALSGALAALVGINEIAGVHGRLLPDFVAGAGFAGIAVSLIGRNHPLGIVLASLLFGALYQGGSELAFEINGFSRDMVFMLQGLIVLFAGAMAQVASPLLFKAWRAVAKNAGGRRDG